MAQIDQTKVCPHCAETIKAAAKVCPHCRYWQNPWSLQNPQILVTIYGIIWIAILGCLATFFEKAFGPKEEFATYRNEIGVIQSDFSTRVSGSNLWITVVGTLTNQSNIGWKDIGVEAQFFDRSGKLIDAITVNSSDYRTVTILPHGEAAFRIERTASHPANDYITNKLTVRWAKDIDAWGLF